MTAIVEILAALVVSAACAAFASFGVNLQTHSDSDHLRKREAGRSVARSPQMQPVSVNAGQTPDALKARRTPA
ncbi:hypothetical protein P7B02_12080 [Caulobacter segnis]|uniref:hypothetical protein n=1 Tax=Caulobacter segnis TaxID=88688 RepID=UPI002410A4B2|nr:hypothetical protein [Caulobacter segnis]MDG2522281.1 hypothetical protein [Caulobacter segnis]